MSEPVERTEAEWMEYVRSQFKKCLLGLVAQESIPPEDMQALRVCLDGLDVIHPDELN